MSREWERALERQLALIEWSETTSAELWMNILRNTSPGLRAGVSDVSRTLGTADTFYVSADILKLVGVASESESLGEPTLERHIPFTKSGFAYFQKPVRTFSAVRESEGEQMRPVELDIHAIAWSHATVDLATTEELAGGSPSKPSPGITFLLYGSDSQLSAYGKWLADPVGTARKTVGLIAALEEQARATEDDVAAIEEKVRRKAGDPDWDDVTAEEEADLRHQVDILKMDLAVTRSSLHDMKQVRAEGVDEFAEKVREVVRSYGLAEYRKAPLDLVDVHAWGFGQPWTIKDLRDEVFSEDENGARAVAESVGFIRRFMFSLWSLMAQPIAAPKAEKPSRAYRRRWEQKVRTAPNYGDVQVITLRRSTHGGGVGPEDEFGPEWSHRWMVRGHWRKQWYPSERVHRLIWIAPFVKGPEDKPLIIKDRVFEVVR